jgi:hypothetical protein
MRKMSSQLIVAATASTLAMAAFALTAPVVEHGSQSGASVVPAVAGLPAPTSLPSFLR